MVFSSLTFIYLFLPLTGLAVIAVGRFGRHGHGGTPSPVSADRRRIRVKNGILLFASLFFYAWGEPVYILLMLLSIIVNYFAGLAIDHFRRHTRPGRARAVYLAALVFNLGLLGVFKYTGFFIEQLRRLWPGFQPDFTGISLPIGISFYTFQILSYIIDLHRGELPVERSLVALGTYIAFFPQLIAGPIVRFADIMRQLQERDETWRLRATGARRFIFGLAKKVLIANRCGAVWASLEQLPPHELPVTAVWLGGLAFGLQIYFDFSGYSDMALGLARLFGFELVENFDHPYIARSVTDFWRRWHLTLSGWFRRYVYLPLGGNRHGLPRQLVNILIVWLLTGFWHGASWNFVVWGLWFALLLIIEKLGLLSLLERLPRPVGHLWTLLAVLLSWMLFAHLDVGTGLAWAARLFGLGPAAPSPTTVNYVRYAWRGAWPLLATAALAATHLPRRLALRLGLAGRPAAMTDLPGEPRRDRRASDGMVPDQTAELPATPVAAALSLAASLILLLLSTAALVNDAFNPFLYFRF